MLSSIIFHFIFAIFAVWAVVAWILESRRLKSVRYALLLILTVDFIELPKHRSLVVRSSKSFEDELKNTLNIKVKIRIPLERNSRFLQNPFRPLCTLLEPQIQSLEKNFKFEGEFLHAAELLQKIKDRLAAQDHRNSPVSFVYLIAEHIWHVEMLSHD